MDISLLNDQELTRRALVRCGNSQTVLTALMREAGLPVTQPTVHRWLKGKANIARNRGKIRPWLIEFIRRVPEDFRVVHRSRKLAPAPRRPYGTGPWAIRNRKKKAKTGEFQ